MLRSHQSRRAAVISAAFLLITGSSAFAQAPAPAPGPAPGPAGDAPGFVGRLSYTEGTVSFHAADQTDWSPATLNYPVTTGASFWTEPNSKAEIQIGDAEARMDQSTELDIVRLDDNATQLRVDQGAINVHVSQLPPGGLAVVTPSGQIDLLQPGSYHVDATPQTDSAAAAIRLTVLDGDARFDGERSQVDVQAGETASIGGSPVNVTLDEGNPTPFDDWALSREHRELAQQAPAGQPPAPPAAQQYVPPGMTGAQDLAANGTWTPTPDYGPVWYPTAVPADWEPYHYGHWAFVPPWGWTWIDDAPWGFAPFHYGRWAYIDGRWGWAPRVPGVEVAVGYRPIYAPALVAFVGGGGFGISLSVGGDMAAVGWVPLAPFEPFHPWYRASPDYMRRVNVVNVNRTTINNITVVNNNVTVNSFHNHSAAIVVSANSFTRAAPVQRAVVRVPPEQLAQVHVAAAGSMRDFKPTPEARAGYARPEAAEAPHAGAQASIAHGPVKMTAPPPSEAKAEPAAAHAPGPRIEPHPAMAARPASAPRPQPSQAAAPRPPANAQAAPAPRPTANAPAAQPHPAAANAPAAPKPAANAPGQPKPPASAQARPQPKPQQPAAAEVKRPQQTTHLAPTANGWKRQAPEGGAKAAPAAKPGEEKEKKPEGQ